MLAAGHLDLVIETDLKPTTSPPSSRSSPAPAASPQLGRRTPQSGAARIIAPPATRACTNRR
jgi:hypothetical protein